MDSLPDFVQPWSFSFQIAFQVLREAGLGDSGRPCEGNFCEVVAVREAGDVGVIRGGERILRLHNFNIVGNSRAEPVAGLPQRLGGERYRAFLDGAIFAVASRSRYASRTSWSIWARKSSSTCCALWREASARSTSPCTLPP